MHQRIIACSCTLDAYPLSQDPASAEADARSFLAQHAHPARPRPRVPKWDIVEATGYLVVFIDGPRNGEVQPLSEYRDVIASDLPGRYAPDEAAADASRVLHYRWQESSGGLGAGDENRTRTVRPGVEHDDAAGGRGHDEACLSNDRSDAQS
jgi:hypothetical protein